MKRNFIAKERRASHLRFCILDAYVFFALMTWWASCCLHFWIWFEFFWKVFWNKTISEEQTNEWKKEYWTARRFNSLPAVFSLLIALHTFGAHLLSLPRWKEERKLRDDLMSELLILRYSFQNWIGFLLDDLVWTGITWVK